MSSIIQLILLILFVNLNLIGTSSYGQDLITKTRIFTQKDGLANFAINDVQHDNEGFLWFATEYGLYRYDGKIFELHTPENSNLFDHRVRELYKDSKGNIWINYFNKITGNNGFLNIDVLNPKTQEVIRLHDYLNEKLPFKYQQITCFNQNEDGTFWFGTAQGKIYEYNQNGFRIVFENDSLEFYGILEKTPSDHGWVNYGYNNKKAIYFKTHGGILDSIDLEIEKSTRQHSIRSWLGREDESVFISIAVPTKNNGKKYYFARKDPYKSIQSFDTNIPSNLSGILLETKKQILAVDYPLRDSFFLFNLQGDCVYRAKRPTNFPIIYNNHIDKYNNIWQGDPGKNQISMTYLKASKFKQHFHYKKIKGSDIATSARDIWVAPDSTIFFAGWHFWTKKNNKITYVDELANLDELKTSLSIQKDHDQPLLWVSNQNEGLFSFNIDSQKVTFYNYPSSIPTLKLAHWSVFQDKKGAIWLGHQKGLSYLDQQTKQLHFYNQYNDFNQLKEASVFHFHENNQGIWLATDRGIFLLSPEKGIIDHFHIKGDSMHYIPHNNIAHIYEDKEGFFWLASKGGGLIQWNPKNGQHKQLTTKQGLSHNIIYAVYEDDYQQLWLSSNYGIMSINKQTFYIKTFHLEDGLSDEEFNTVSHYKTADGRIFFGGLNGFTSFHPKDFQEEETQQHPLRLTAFKKQNQASGFFENRMIDLVKDSSNTIYISPNDKSFIFEFSLLDFRAPNTHKYAYKIEGIDQDWNYLPTGEIRLNNLPYGTFTLKIKAQGLGGQWNKQELHYKLIALKPFYEQWWFILLVAGIVIGSVFSFYRWRILQLQQQQERLELIVQERTKKIEEDREFILQQAEELKALDKLKSRFFANISHELRTPLTLIISPLSYTLDNIDNFKTEEIRHFLDTSIKNGYNLLDLVEEILDLAKLEAKQLFLLETPISINNLIQSVFSKFEPKFKEQGLKYHLILPQGINDLYLLLDKNKLEKIINNFLSNAIKHTPADGKITLKLEDRQNKMQLSVSDTGKGIPPNDLPYIFDRFYQSKAPDAANQGGTGIGLSLVKEFAQLMQGQISVHSIVNKGSTFLFEFPKKEISIPQAMGSITEDTNEIDDESIIELSGNYTILVVEDNTDMRNFIETLLKKYYTVLSANNGLEGLKILEEQGSNIDLILSDVMMPQMDGLTMFRKIKSTTKWRHIPTITLTALSSKKNKLDALCIGIDDYLTKPFSAAELLVRVKNMLYNYSQRILFHQESNQSELSPLSIAQVKANKELIMTDEDFKWLQEVELHTKENINNSQFRVLQLSFKMNMTEKTFRRHLNRLTGLTPNKYITELRLQEARELLEQRKYNSIQSVCYSVGFKTPKYFSKLYKQRFGITPAEYI